MRIGAYVAMLALLASPVAAPSATSGTNSIGDECSDGSQAELRDCLTQQARDSEIALSQAEKTAREVIVKWDEDGKYVAAALKRFDAANKFFVQYRQANCAFASALGGGAIGSALELRRLRCIATLNRQQADHVKNSVANLPLRDSR